jgi:hypothetical protein
VRLSEALQKLAEAWARLRDRPPKEVEDELAKDYGNVEEWRARGGGIAPDDAQHIDEGGI